MSEFADAFYEVAKGKIECAECIRLRLMKHGHYVPEKTVGDRGALRQG